jgi:hypothetical protein
MNSFSYNTQIECFLTHVDNGHFFLVLVCGTRVQSLSAPFSYTLYNIWIKRNLFFEKSLVGL